jgi:hypothetical protein
LDKTILSIKLLITLSWRRQDLQIISLSSLSARLDEERLILLNVLQKSTTMEEL